MNEGGGCCHETIAGVILDTCVAAPFEATGKAKRLAVVLALEVSLEGTTFYASLVTT